MSTVQPTASPRAPRGKQQPPQSPAQPPHNNASRQSQRKARGNRAQNGHHHHQGNAASPTRNPSGAVAIAMESALPAGADAPAHTPAQPRNARKHTHSQPSVDRTFSPPGNHAPLTDSESTLNNPSATPAKTQGAYAGPTFHASPAPSALPIPKFLSRSVPAKTRAGPPTPPPEDSSDSANSPSPSASPSRPPGQSSQRNGFSPLDMLFKADQAERARHVNGNSNHSMFTNPVRPQPFQHDSFNSFHGVFPIELDGESKNPHMSLSPVPSPVGPRSFTDPQKVPQLKDLDQPTNGNDIMQDLMNRLSMSHKKHHANTPPKHDVQVPSDPRSRKTPSPFHDGQPQARSASGPSTPQQVNPEQPDFFYGNRNLSPLFKAAQGDTPKRNSGLRTEVTVDSPMVLQGAFQEFPSVQKQLPMDPNTFSRGPPGSDDQNVGDTRRGSGPFSPPYQRSPNRGRGTPRGQPQHPRGRDFQGRGYHHGAPSRGGRVAGNMSPGSASAPKPTTTMMSFVPASVAAKAKPKPVSVSIPPVAELPPPTTLTSQDTISLEHDLKRLLNLKTGDSPIAL